MSFNNLDTIAIIAIIISVFIIIIGVFLIARWIYIDAKSRGINPLPWILMTLFISPNFLGLIIYILTRPKSEIFCPNCRKSITKEMNYCPNCAVRIETNPFSYTHKTSNKLLIWGIALIVTFSIASIIGIGIYSMPDSKGFKNSSISRIFDSTSSYSATSMVNTNFNNKWKCSFKTLNGCKRGNFRAKSETPMLIYSSEITKGNITFEVFDDKDNIIETIPSNVSGEVTNLVQGTKYKVVATTDGVAGGKFSFEMK